MVRNWSLCINPFNKALYEINHYEIDSNNAKFCPGDPRFFA
jgi:hypothetical protein